MEYAQFNAGKTVSDARPSLFTVVEVGPLTVTTDRARNETYYQRILGLSPSTLPWLDRALEFFEGREPAPRIDIDMRELQSLEEPLRSRGFAAGDEIIWLASRRSPGPPPMPVIRLLPGDADRLLPLIEFNSPVDPKIWALRRQHHCTERFRTFAIEADGEIAAMATSFIGKHGVILGNAFTLPGQRGRGYQNALIAARLSDAEELGLDRVVTDVEPQTTSLRNCERSGFTTLLHQSVWERVKRE